MNSISITEIIKMIEVKERQAKKRAIAFTFIPLVAAIVLITYTSKRVIEAQYQLNNIKSEVRDANLKLDNARREIEELKKTNTNLKIKNDSLSQSLIESVISLGQALSVTVEYKKFIDKMKPYSRSQAEASFYINFRMLEDKIRGNYEHLSETISELPKLDENKNWIVIVESSRSLEDLKAEVNKLASIYSSNQVAIYKDSKGYYALSVKGNGTFTRAYRLNVELRDKHGYRGSYFSGAADWGTNYLNK